MWVLTHFPSSPAFEPRLTKEQEATEKVEDYMLCAGCQSGALLKVECHEFEWEDEDSETTMTKNVSVSFRNVQVT